MNLLENIRANKELNERLMRECDIYFYKEEQEIEFSGNNEEYSIGCMAFAQDGTGRAHEARPRRPHVVGTLLRPVVARTHGA